LGSLYALVAIGFTLIFGVGGIFNLSHGAFLAVGAYTAYIVSGIFGINIYIGIIISILASLCSGFIIYFIIKDVENDPFSVMMLTLLSAFIVQYVFGTFVTRGRFFVPVILSGQYNLFGVGIKYTAIFNIITSWLIISLIYLFINITDLGKAIIALSMNKKGAKLVGINKQRLNIYTWIIAAALAGYSGVLFGSFTTGAWDMGWEPLMLAFAIVIIGGLGSITGSVIAAYLIAFIEISTTTIISPQLTGIPSLTLMIVMLMFRPSGIFGREEISHA